LAARVELAGLTLSARGEAAAGAVLFPPYTAAGLPPEMRGRYGWWYYRAGNFDRAAELLTGAVQERPADARMQVQLGWALVDQHKLEDAIERFNAATNQYSYPVYGALNPHTRLFNEMRVGLAVAQWQAHEFDRAVGELAGASIAQPEWLNPQWVGALYSPGVAKTIEEMKAERKKRHTEHRRGDF
jgi:tetratricopeptide (TPR) repeat protein